MNIRRSRNRPLLDNRQNQKQKQQRQQFLKCSVRVVVFFLGLIILAYLSILVSFLKNALGSVDDEVDDGRITIGIASTVTGCGSDPFIDGAAVLKHSLDINSQGPESRFKYKNYVMYHPSAKECVAPLKSLGYILLERPTPIKVEEIGGDGGLRERIVNNGCCGEVSA